MKEIPQNFEKEAGETRSKSPVDFYIEFETESEKQRAFEFLKKELGKGSMSYGSDWHAEDDLFYKPDLKNISQDPNRPEGLNLSYSKPPQAIGDPDILKDRILDFLHKNGFKLKNIGGKPEVYEVIHGADDLPPEAHSG